MECGLNKHEETHTMHCDINRFNESVSLLKQIDQKRHHLYRTELHDIVISLSLL